MTVVRRGLKRRRQSEGDAVLRRSPLRREEKGRNTHSPAKGGEREASSSDASSSDESEASLSDESASSEADSSSSESSSHAEPSQVGEGVYRGEATSTRNEVAQPPERDGHLTPSHHVSLPVTIGPHVEFDDEGSVKPARLVESEVHLRVAPRRTVEVRDMTAVPPHPRQGWERTGWRRNNPARDARRDRTPKRGRKSGPPASALPTDYSTWPPLVGLPAGGVVMAFKVVEVSARWVPEVSDWKEAVVLAVASGALRLSSLLWLTCTESGRLTLELRTPPPSDEPDDLRAFAHALAPPPVVTEVTLAELIDPRVQPSRT